MNSENVFELLSSEEELKAVTSYSVSAIWEKRPFLSGSTDHKVVDTMDFNIKREEKYIGDIIENTGIDSPAVEIRPVTEVIEKLQLAHVYWTQVTSAHDYNDLVRRYNQAFNGYYRGDQKIINVLKEWSLGIYDSVVNKYVMACEKGLCQALTNPAGWVIPAKANQEPKIYDPRLEHDITGNLADFDTQDPTLKLLEDLVLKAQIEGHSPNVIFVGDLVAKAILSSPWYNTNNRTAPVSNAFSFTPGESSNMIMAKGALELVGIYVAGCKIIWINSMFEGVPLFDPNCAVALNDNQWATIYSGPTFANMQSHSDIIRFTPAPIVNEKEIRYFCEYSYLPVINKPGEIYRAYYN